MRPGVSCESRLRPRDDAPHNDITLWEGLDCSFIYNYTHELAEACLYAGGSNMAAASSSLSSRAQSMPGVFDPAYEAAAVGGNLPGAAMRDMHDSNSAQSNYLARMHVYPSDRPCGFWASMCHWLLPSYFRQRRRCASLAQMHAMTSAELLKRMQCALAAGDREQSALVAEELSTRRVTLPLGRLGEMGVPAYAEPTGFSDGGAQCMSGMVAPR